MVVDTGSPVSIVSLEYLLQVLVKKPLLEREDPEAWVRGRLQSTTLSLRNYNGGELPIVRQICLAMKKGGHSSTALVQVERGALVEFLLGTDLQPTLGYRLIQEEEDGIRNLLQPSTC